MTKVAQIPPIDNIIENTKKYTSDLTNFTSLIDNKKIRITLDVLGVEL